MAKGIIAFLSIWAMLYVGIEIFRAMSGKEKWVTVKTIVYAGMLAAFAVGILVGIVLVF